MRAVIRRLRSGERWWAAEVAFRAGAVVFLGLAALCLIQLERSVDRPPAHEASLAEFAMSGAGVVLFSAGIACLIEGPGLFRLVPYPRTWLI